MAFGRSESGVECHIVNLHTGFRYRVRSVWDIVESMENDLSANKFPQGSIAYRSWGLDVLPGGSRLPDKTANTGGAGDGLPPASSGPTFIVKVLFRQHATWQGTVQWIEGRQYRQYRSLNELLLLMGEALAAPPAAPE